jgi:hypothetical protein
MSAGLLVQGRQLTEEDILRIRRLISDHPTWSRRRISEVLCAEWNWCNGSGRLKDMAARILLVKLDARGLIMLPARRRMPSNRMAARQAPRQMWDSTPVTGTLCDMGPLTLREVSADTTARIRFAGTSYKASNWLRLGATTGRSRQDCRRKLQVPVKDVYLYPLAHRFREELSA